MAVIISFAYNWVLSLIILAVVPIIAIAGSLEAKTLLGKSKNKDVESAGKVSICCIHTVEWN